MKRDKIFNSAAVLIAKLEDSKRTGTIEFKSADEKLTLSNVYQEIFRVQVNLGCNDCVKQCLYFLQAWYEREYPLYVKATTALAATDSPQTSESTPNKGKRKKQVKGK